MLGAAEGKDALLGARFFFIATGATDRAIESVHIQRLLQGLRLHHIGMHGGAVRYWTDARRHAIWIGVHTQVHASLGDSSIPKRDHLGKLPAGVDMQQRHRRPRRIKSLQQQMQQHRAVLANRVHQHRIAKLGRALAQDVDAFGF